MTAKSWGPFSGAQLTVIITAALLSVAIPGGLWASGIQYSNVSLYDPSSGQRAKIGTGGAMKITNGVGALTVSGHVSEAAPGNLIRFYSALSSGAQCTKLYTPATNSGVILKRASINTYAVTSPGAGQYAGFVIGNSCAAVFALTNPATVGVASFDFGDGVLIRPGEFSGRMSTAP